MLAAGVHDCYSMALHEICILLLPAGVLGFICYIYEYGVDAKFTLLLLSEKSCMSSGGT